MFCRKCGTRNNDGDKFCINCGAPLAASSQPAGKAEATPQGASGAATPAQPQATPVPPQPVAPAQPQGAPVPPAGIPASQQQYQQPAYQQPTYPQQPAYQQQPTYPQQAYYQQPAYQQPAYQQPSSPRRSKLPIVIGAVVAVVAAIAVAAFVVMPMLDRGPWTGSMMLDGVSASYDHEFGIKTDGKTVTVYDQDDVITGSISGTHEEDGQIFYDVKDINWGSWGGDAFRSSSVTNKVMTIIVPKGASAAKPYGRWSVVVSASDNDDNDYPLFMRSTTLEFDEDGTGYYEFASEWGKSSDVAKADPTNSAYDPASSGWKHPLTSNGSNGTYNVSFNDDTFSLTFTDDR